MDSTVTRMRGEGGFALVITLVITALLVALAVEFIDDVFVETSSRQNFIDAQQASLMANSGIEGGIKLVQFTNAAQSYTTLADPWAKPLKIDDEKGVLQVTIEDESSRLNINQIVGPNGTPDDFYYMAMARLLKKEGLSLDLRDALSDWIDENDEPRPGGAESPFYLKLKQPYRAKNGTLQTLEELALVSGFDTQTINRLRREITVYGDRAQININTAPQNVIASLSDGMTDELAKRVVEYRITTPFKTPADILRVPGLELAQGLNTTYLSVKGTMYRIYSEAKVNDTTRTVEAVVTPEGSFLYWREF